MPVSTPVALRTYGSCTASTMTCHCQPEANTPVRHKLVSCKCMPCHTYGYCRANMPLPMPLLALLLLLLLPRHLSHHHPHAASRFRHRLLCQPHPVALVHAQVDEQGEDTAQPPPPRVLVQCRAVWRGGAVWPPAVHRYSRFLSIAAVPQEPGPGRRGDRQMAFTICNLDAPCCSTVTAGRPPVPRCRPATASSTAAAGASASATGGRCGALHQFGPACCRGAGCSPAPLAPCSSGGGGGGGGGGR